ncbi:hypothetical protein A1Q2_03758 [Trichosporon asahii var. asahii CBS 8904]|uniref:Uncharacterized protein n=1 Tax=Trichosporon asahii var. asahii (strain CBS 8904) TaxID=1220162 RepID=K1WL00_TRIAC|nr:hypothetical protein A1Q2_03758 [Trichosporon asahii var. asahii CBS 8904]
MRVERRLFSLMVVAGLEERSSKLDTTISENNRLSTRIDEIRGDRDAARSKIAKLEGKLAEIKKELTSAVHEREMDAKQAAAELSLAQSRQRDAEERAERLRGEAPADAQARDAEFKALYDRIERRDVRLQNLQVELDKLRMNYAVAQEDIGEFTDDLAAAKAENAELKQELTRAQAEAAAKATAVEELTGQLDARAEEIAASQQKSAELESDMATLKDEHEALTHKHTSVIADRDSYAATVNATRAELQARKFGSAPPPNWLLSDMNHAQWPSGSSSQ